MKAMFDKWVLDVTFWNPQEEMPTFIPIESNGDLVIGMNCMGFCPGELIGIVHLDGQEKVNKWYENEHNKKLFEQYQKEAGKMP